MPDSTTTTPNPIPAAAQLPFRQISDDEHFFLPSENPSDFHSLLDDDFSAFKPGCQEHANLVFDLVLARWRLWRRQRVHAHLEHDLYTSREKSPLWNQPDYEKLNYMDNFLKQGERSLQRNLANVRLVCKDAAGEKKWRAQLELAHKRVEIAVVREARRAIIEGVKIAAIEADRKANEELAEVLNSKEPIQVKDGQAYIKQAIYLSTDENEMNVVDEVAPSNAEVRSLIAQRNDNPVPPTEVIRYYHFCGGAKIQPNFAFLVTDREMFDAIEPKIKVPLSFAEFRSISRDEDATSAHPPQE